MGEVRKWEKRRGVIGCRKWHRRHHANNGDNDGSPGSKEVEERERGVIKINIHNNNNNKTIYKIIKTNY